MEKEGVVVVLGTFDSKGEEHLFLKQGIEARGLKALTMNVGTLGPARFTPDMDLRPPQGEDRDQAIAQVIQRAREALAELHAQGRVLGVISAGGGSGTHLATSVMKVLPLGVPKVMVSTVAAHDMAPVVGTKDITMIHSVGDLLGVNSLSGMILDQAAGAICGMARSHWQAPSPKPRVALTMFGFITKAAEEVKRRLEEMGLEVIAFHANGIGGLAMEELAGQGLFDAILDLAPHELADSLCEGYCKLIGPGRLEPLTGRPLPRLVVPGGLDCAVLEFTRDTVPAPYRQRKIFFYDFRSAVRLSRQETETLARDLAAKLNRATGPVKVLIPGQGWSEADGPGAPLYDPELSAAFVALLKEGLDEGIEVLELPLHINHPDFAAAAARLMAQMLETGG